MSLAYTNEGPNIFVWAFAAIASIGLHTALPYWALKNEPPQEIEEVSEFGLTGAILFDLSDIVAAPELDTEDNVETAEAEAVQTVTDSPEVVEPAKAAEEPILSQIPYEVEDDSLKFGVASPEPAEENEEMAEEVATQFDPEKIETAAQAGADASVQEDASVLGTEAPEAAESAMATKTGLTSEQKAEVSEWQKNIVLQISKERRYPRVARKKRIVGEVTVKFTIDKYGAILTKAIAKTSGWPVLDKAAMEIFDEVGKLPTPPNYLSGNKFTLLIPIRYSFR